MADFEISEAEQSLLDRAPFDWSPVPIGTGAADPALAALLRREFVEIKYYGIQRRGAGVDASDGWQFRMAYWRRREAAQKCA